MVWNIIISIVHECLNPIPTNKPFITQVCVVYSDISQLVSNSISFFLHSQAMNWRLNQTNIVTFLPILLHDFLVQLPASSNTHNDYSSLNLWHYLKDLRPFLKQFTWTKLLHMELSHTTKYRFHTKNREEAKLN